MPSETYTTSKTRENTNIKTLNLNKSSAKQHLTFSTVKLPKKPVVGVTTTTKRPAINEFSQELRSTFLIHNAIAQKQNLTTKINGEFKKESSYTTIAPETNISQVQVQPSTRSYESNEDYDTVLATSRLPFAMFSTTANPSTTIDFTKPGKGHGFGDGNGFLESDDSHLLTIMSKTPAETNNNNEFDDSLNNTLERVTKTADNNMFAKTGKGSGKRRLSCCSCCGNDNKSDIEQNILSQGNNNKKHE